MTHESPAPHDELLRSRPREIPNVPCDGAFDRAGRPGGPVHGRGGGHGPSDD